jgi:hypothetical protein
MRVISDSGPADVLLLVELTVPTIRFPLQF